MRTALFEKNKHTEWYITDTGQVFTKTTWHSDNVLKERRVHKNRKRGYAYVRTPTHNYLAHRLVATAFIPNPHNKPQVNHVDGNKLNNHVSNLEWVTAAENAQHAIKSGLTRQVKKNEGNIKYTNEQCREVLALVQSGMKYVDAGKVHNMPYSTVAHLVRGSRRKV